MSCEEKNNKRRKKRLLSKQSFDMNAPLHQSVESGKGRKKGHTYLDSQVSPSQLANNTPKAGTPCIDGERCLLCGKERYDRCQKGELSKSVPCNSSASLSQAPLWICPDCRRIIEEEERRAAMEISLPDQDLMLQPSLNLTLSMSPHSCGEQTKCGCHNCSNSSLKEDTINGAILDKEKQQLRCCWSELRNVVRCIYREAGTSLADEEETVRSSLDENRLKMKVDRLMNNDPAQLFDKLETQAREYVREVKVRLIKFLTSCPMSPHHAKEFFAMLLDEYQALSNAFDILQPFFRKLDTDHLHDFGLSWDLLHKHLFYIEIYRDHAVYSNLPALITQLRLGAVSRENYHQDSFPSLLHRYLNFTDDLTEIEFSWKESERAFKLYKETQAKLQERKGTLPIEWEVEQSGTENHKHVQNISKSLQHRCQCGHCSGSSSPLAASPPFCASGSLSNVSSPTSTTENTANHPRWTNPATVSDFNPRLVMCNDLHSIPPSQLLPPPLVTNGLGNSCHCPAYSGTNGYREAVKTEQSSNGKMADCQCSKCPYHGGKDQESKSRSLNHPSPTAVYPPPPNNNHIPNNCLHAHHVTAPGTPLHCPLDDPLQHLRGRIIENNLRHLKYDVFRHQLNGHREIDYDENSESDSNSDDEDEDDDDDDDDVSSSSPRRSSQSSVDIDGLALEVPPGSPSSVRSSGDGSSCDTPPVNQCTSSTLEDGRTERGKYCDCCYCEFFGHAAPPVAPTSHNYTEIRDKLRLRLNKRQPNQSVQDKKVNAPVVDDRSVDDLLSFINDEKGEDENHGSNSKARKRARKKQKKAAEKVNSVPTESNTMNGVHQHGAVEVQRKQLEETAKQISTAKDCRQKDDKQAAPSRKTEEPEQKRVEAGLLQEEDPQRAGKLNKKQNHSQGVMRDNTLSRSESRQQCNGKENSCNNWRGVERSNKRQDSVSPDPATNRSHIREVLEKSDSTVRVPQKKQGKKKKKASLDDVFLPREDIENDKLTQMDEAERELEEFKRFCMNLTPVERRERIPVNVNLKGLLGGKRNGSS